MCKAIEKMIEDGRSEGLIKGRDEGRMEMLSACKNNVIDVSTAAGEQGIANEAFLELMKRY